MSAPGPASNGDDGERSDFVDRYRSVSSDPRELRPRSANRSAAVALLAALVLIVVLVAILN